MSDLRDDFAQTALLGLLSSPRDIGRNATADDVAGTAWAIADAMMATRNLNVDTSVKQE